MRFQKNESVASGSPAATATSASGIRIVVFRLRHHIGSQPQGAERCDGRDIEDDPHGRSPLRKPAVQVSRQELLAARVIELGLAPAVAGKSFECDFPASLAAHQTFAIAGRPHVVVQDRHRPRGSSRRTSRSAPREKQSPHAGHGPLDTAVQHGRLHPAKNSPSKAIGHNSRP
jgi:hypothetical protein